MSAENELPTPVEAPADFIYTETDVKPEYPGGDGLMWKYIYKNVKYPDEAADNRISGKVVVSFVVERDGRLPNLEVIESVHPLLDEEALRVIGRMTRWVPGRKNGEVCRSQYTIPFHFRLKD